MMHESSFPLRSYAKSELAMLYFPTTPLPRTATNHLMNWIRRCTPLIRELEKLGYRKTSKWFSRREVALIIEYLGEP